MRKSNFQIVHQSSELLLRGAENEMSARWSFWQEGMHQAAKLLRRANHYLDLTIDLMGNS